MKHIAYHGIGLALLLGVLGLPASAQDQSQQSDSSLGAYARQIRKDSDTKKPTRTFDNDNLPKDDKLSVVGPAPESGPESSTASPEGAPAAGESKPATEAKGEGEAAKSGEEKNETKAENKSAEKSAEKSDDKTKTEAAAESTTETKAEAKPEAPPLAPGQVASAAAQNAAAPAAPSTPEEEQAAKEKMNKQWGEKLDSQKDSINLLNRELDVLEREYKLRAAAMYGDAGNRFRNQADWDKQDAQYKQQIADKQKAIDDAKQKLDDMQEDARKAGVPSSASEQ